MNEYRPLIARHAGRFGLSPQIVEGVCIVESDGNPWATRFEPQWHWLLNPLNYAAMVNTTERTEIIHQQTSWGLMQLMGTVLRELGHVLPLPQALEPNTNIYYGCLKLSQLMKRYGKIGEAIEAYNAGRPGTVAGMAYKKKVTKACMSLSS